MMLKTCSARWLIAAWCILALKSFSEEANSGDFYIPFDASWVDFAAEFTFSTLVSLYRQQGLQADWEKTLGRQGSTAYRLEVTGDGYEQLESALNVDLSTIVGENIPGEYALPANKPYYLDVEPSGDEVTISANFGEVGQYNAVLAGLYQQDIFIHGRRVISSNAQEIRSGSAIWHNPSSIQITILPGTAFNPILVGILLTVLLIGGVIAIVIVIIQRPARIPSHGPMAGHSRAFGSRMTPYQPTARRRMHPSGLPIAYRQSGSNKLWILLLIAGGIIIGLIVVIVVLLTGQAMFPLAPN